MTAPTTAGGAVLPAEVVKRLESSLDWMLKGMHTGLLVSAVDYRLIIGWLGQIDALRAENERLKRSLQQASQIAIDMARELGAAHGAAIRK